MKSSSQPARTATLYLAGVVLTVTSFILGAIPINASYHKQGRGFYWLTWVLISGTVFGLGFHAAAASLLTMTILVGTYNEFKSSHVTHFTAGLAATFFASSLWFLGLFYWVKLNGNGWLLPLKQRVEEFLQRMFPGNGSELVNVNLNELVYQLPSALVIVFLFSLFLAILFENKVKKWVNAPIAQSELKSLLSFRLPEWMIWLFIGSLLTAFVNTEYKFLNPVGMNILNIVLVVYFFQGLAVLSCFFNFIKASALWKFIMFFLLVTQLFLVVSLVGVLDFWMDFRLRMLRKSADMKNTWTNKA